MKYFTLEWWQDERSVSESARILRGYQAHLAAIRDRLTPDLLLLESDISLHDGIVRTIRLDVRERRLRVAVDADDGEGGLRKVELLYSDVATFEGLGLADHARGLCGGFGYVGYMEIDIVGDRFEHRILFDSGIEFRIEFGKFHLQWSDESPTFDPRDLDATDSDVRCGAVIEVSRRRLCKHEPKLLKIGESDADLGVRRHAIRGLGNLGAQAGLPLFLKILATCDGLIVGDAVMALAQIGAVESLAEIATLQDSPEPWIAQQARHAVKILAGK